MRDPHGSMIPIEQEAEEAVVVRWLLLPSSPMPLPDYGFCHSPSPTTTSRPRLHCCHITDTLALVTIFCAPTFPLKRIRRCLRSRWWLPLVSEALQHSGPFYDHGHARRHWKSRAARSAVSKLANATATTARSRIINKRRVHLSRLFS